MAFKPIQFFTEVKREFDKVTWPAMAETRMSTIMVFVMAGIAAMFLLVTDQVISAFLKLVLNIKG